MDKDKIYEAAHDVISQIITRQTPADAPIINDAVSKAIAAAFEEY